MIETVAVTDQPPDEAIATLRRTALLFLGHAISCAARAGLGPEDAARFFKEQRPQLGSPIRTEAELEEFARGAARFMALLHGHVALERKGTGWSCAVPLADDRTAIESFTTLDAYARWHAEFDRDLREGVSQETWLEGDTYRFELRLAGPRP